MLSRRRFPDLTRRVKNRRRAPGDETEKNARFSLGPRRRVGSLSLSLSLSLCLSVSLFLTLVFGAAAAPQDSGGNIRERRDDVSVEISFRMSGSAACLEKLE